MSTLEQIRKQLNKELLHLRATNNSSALVITNIVADIGDIITAQNTIHKSNYAKCPDCGGYGKRGSTALNPCPTCNGTGQIA